MFRFRCVYPIVLFQLFVSIITLMIHVACAAQIDCGYITNLPVVWVLPFFDNSFEPGRLGRICIPSGCHWTSAARVTQNCSYNKTNEMYYFRILFCTFSVCCWVCCVDTLQCIVTLFPCVCFGFCGLKTHIFYLFIFLCLSHFLSYTWYILIFLFFSFLAFTTHRCCH
jgi:hypothetical protein